MMARLIGSILWVRGDAFDWGPEHSFRDPVLSEDARGTRRKANSGLFPEGEAAASPEAWEPVKEKPEPMLARDVVQALGQRQNARALKLYESRRSWSDKTFNERQLFDLGTAAVNASKLDLAETLLEGLTEAKGPLGGRAMLALAKVYEQTNQAYRARQLYREILEKFPGTDMARAADAKLGAS
jgi:hypothetical protein